MSLGRTAFQLGFEISPIILTGGLAKNMPLQMLPIVALTQAADFVGGLLTGSLSLNLDDFFAHFKPIPGATLAANQIGKYPFANQTVAANAMIFQPLTISMLMICPAKPPLGYPGKFLTMTALKMALNKHVQSGGTFTVVTQSALYANCVLLGLTDVSSGDSGQAQTHWRWDFEQPLIAELDATGALNSLMSKIDGGLPTGSNPAWSGAGAATSPVMGSVPGVASGQNVFGTLINSDLQGINNIKS